jgi:hypothetical protein
MRLDKLIPIVFFAANLAGCNFLFADGGGSSSGGGGSAPVTDIHPSTCGNTAACPVAQQCLATVENHGEPRFGLRIAELGFSSPASFADQGGVQALLVNLLFAPDLQACGLLGGGDSSWLLGFDLAASTLTVGGAPPPADASSPYALADQTIQQGTRTIAIAPVTYSLSVGADGSFSTTAAQDLQLPMFFPGSGPTEDGPHALTLHALTFSNMVVSATHDCIGSYDPAIFDTQKDCNAGTGATTYVHAGRLEAYISLEEADTLPISTLDETMCALIAGSSSFLDSSGPMSTCARGASGAIAFKGNWCSATNAAATATCFDAARVVATFAASAALVQ